MTTWHTNKISDIATVRRGGSPRPIQDYLVSSSESGYNWLRIGDVPPGGRYIKKITAHIKPEGLKKTLLVHSGELILSNSMSFGRPYILKVDACIHDGWLAIQDIDNTQILPSYLYYLLTSTKLQSQFKNLSAGSGVQNLKKETVQAISYASPTIAEQERIVGVLEVWDAYLEKLEHKIALKEQLKKGLMQQLFGSRNEAKMPTYKHELIDLLHISKEKFDPAKSDKEYRCIELECLRKGRSKLLKTIPSSGQRSIKNMFRAGDILFGKLRPYLRKFLFASFDGVCSTEIWVLRNTSLIDNLFAFYLVQSERFIVTANRSSGSRMPRADWGLMKTTTFLIPCDVTQQRHVAQLLKCLDDNIELLESKQDAIKEQKKYLLNNLVTGKIRTPEGLKPLGAKGDA